MSIDVSAAKIKDEGSRTVLACLAMLGWFASRLLLVLYADSITEAPRYRPGSETDRPSDGSGRPPTSTGKGSHEKVPKTF